MFPHCGPAPSKRRGGESASLTSGLGEFGGGNISLPEAKAPNSALRLRGERFTLHQRIESYFSLLRSAFFLLAFRLMPLAPSRSRRVNPQRTQTANFAGNWARTPHVRNLSFSLPSLLALAVAVVRISQATTRPRLISLPTNYCGFIACAVWLRMGTEGTVTIGLKTGGMRGSVPGSTCRGVGSHRRVVATHDSVRPLTATEPRTVPIPSLHLFETKPTIARGSGKKLRLQSSSAGPSPGNPGNEPGRTSAVHRVPCHPELCAALFSDRSSPFCFV